MTVSVHAFTETELEAVDEVTKVAYNVQESRKESLRFYLALQPGVFVSANNDDALKLLTRYGFSQQRGLSHMCKGKHVPRSRHTMLYGQASLGFG